jgi:hypothetical protein
MEEQKKEECCQTTKSGCGCCGAKKFVFGLVLALVIFTCGYIFGKGYCPLSPCHKVCPIMQHN